MNGRLFGGNVLSCFYWDGKTDYRRAPETKEEAKKRIEEFGKWLGDEKVLKDDKSDDELEEKPKEPEVSNEVAEAIQKIVDEKLAQLHK